MLIDGLTLVSGSQVTGLDVSATIESGTSFPSSPTDGQQFRLTTATSTYEAGIYTWSAAASEWTNPLVEIAKNSNFVATGKKGSNVGINPTVLNIASGIAFPSNPSEGQKFRLTAATAEYEVGEYTYEGTEWTNALVKLAKDSSFTANGKKGSTVKLNSASSAIPYDIGMQIIGKPDASAVVGRFVAVRAFKLPAGMTGSRANSGVAATASTVLSVKKNGSQIGTITFAAAGTAGTFAAASETSFAIGDVFTLTAAASQDTTFADAQITFAAVLA